MTRHLASLLSPDHRQSLAVCVLALHSLFGNFFQALLDHSISLPVARNNATPPSLTTWLLPLSLFPSSSVTSWLTLVLCIPWVVCTPGHAGPRIFQGPVFPPAFSMPTVFFATGAYFPGLLSVSIICWIMLICYKSMIRRMINA